jgi:hypothetical protein
VSTAHSARRESCCHTPALPRAQPQKPVLIPGQLVHLVCEPDLFRNRRRLVTDDADVLVLHVFERAYAVGRSVCEASERERRHECGTFDPAPVLPTAMCSPSRLHAMLMFLPFVEIVWLALEAAPRRRIRTRAR